MLWLIFIGYSEAEREIVWKCPQNSLKGILEMGLDKKIEKETLLEGNKRLQ